MADLGTFLVSGKKLKALHGGEFFQRRYYALSLVFLGAGVRAFISRAVNARAFARVLPGEVVVSRKEI